MLTWRPTDQDMGEGVRGCSAPTVLLPLPQCTYRSVRYDVFISCVINYYLLQYYWPRINVALLLQYLRHIIVPKHLNVSQVECRLTCSECA